MSNGVMFAVPIPEEYEQVGQEIQKAVELALQEAEEQGINRRGKEVTPWLLQRVSEHTAGRSLPSSPWFHAIARDPVELTSTT